MLLEGLRSSSLRRDFTSAAFWTGVTGFLFICFGALTLQLSVVAEFGLSSAQEESWITITWLTTVAVSLFLTLRLRQPIAIAWSIPVLVFMGGLSDGFSYGEFTAASLIAGIAITALGLTGTSTRALRLLPLPILMGMFAGTILVFITRMVEATANDLALVGPMVVAYLVGRFVRSQRIPPVGLAVLAGAVLIPVLGRGAAPDLQFGAPSLVIPPFEFSRGAILSLSVPMVVLVLGLGNAPGAGLLSSRGYSVSADTMSKGAGLGSIVNAVFGGHPNALTAIVTALISGPEAGPVEKRYWAAIVAWLPAVAIALMAGLIVSVVSALPPQYITAVAGLTILSSFEEAVSRAFGSTLRFGAVVAFCVTLSSFDAGGLPPALWALAAGLVASLMTEHRELRAEWSSGESRGG